METKQEWLRQEQNAIMYGWDFSSIEGKFRQEELPWDYLSEVKTYLNPEVKLLDLDTGGGEVLLSLGHPYANTAATENYPPNVKLCEEKLLPLGIDFKQADAKECLPYPDQHFDLVLDRHGDYHAKEIYRVLKPGGIFITQQVGAENDRELVEAVLEKLPPLPFPKQYLKITKQEFIDAGFTILKGKEAYLPIRFFDVGALVWFAKIIEWEFPGFSVERCYPQLLALQQKLERGEEIEGRIHRYLMVAQK